MAQMLMAISISCHKFLTQITFLSSITFLADHVTPATLHIFTLSHFHLSPLHIITSPDYPFTFISVYDIITYISSVITMSSAVLYDSFLIG
ncbi:hypothetical protein DFH29DRAFT_125768 [Suillus ampliporus]|nr:hypothetical protein DFH29DRAFT_125768 [Suillus ampliporus]